MANGANCYGKRRLAPYGKHPVRMRRMLKMSVINDKAHMYYVVLGSGNGDNMRQWSCYNYSQNRVPETEGNCWKYE